MKLNITIDPKATYKEFFDFAIRGTGWDVGSTPIKFFNDSTRAGTEGVANIPRQGKFSDSQQYLMRKLNAFVAHDNGGGFAKSFFENLLYRSYVELREGTEILDEIYLYRAGQGGGIFAELNTVAAATEAVMTNGVPSSQEGYVFMKPFLADPCKTYEMRHRYQPRDGGGVDPATEVDAAGAGAEGSFAMITCGFLGRHTS